ncbi:MAG: hypothetical protein KDB07_12060, partial [Planctomycetes bacterium]|nr:hypothetical protein [Planctomycetota bacterium]
PLRLGSGIAMLSGLTPTELARARYIAKPELDQGHLTVLLPMVLDGVNARVLRKMVLLRLPDCHSLRFDASQLKVLGRVGSASLWQMLLIAERHGTRVHLVGVSESVYAALQKVKIADSKRRELFEAAERQITFVVQDNEEREGRARTKTVVITREGAEERATAKIEEEEPKRRWSERVVLKLISRSRRNAA